VIITRIVNGHEIVLEVCNASLIKLDELHIILKQMDKKGDLKMTSNNFNNWVTEAKDRFSKNSAVLDILSEMEEDISEESIFTGTLLTLAHLDNGIKAIDSEFVRE
jgi:hypothetical protein